MLFYGYIDRQGKLVIPTQFDGAGAFQRGFAAVQTSDGLRIIGRNGRSAAGPFKEREPQ
jgi:hypothetical protein